MQNLSFIEKTCIHLKLSKMLPILITYLDDGLKANYNKINQTRTSPCRTFLR